jgi:hypothetical protein
LTPPIDAVEAARRVHEHWNTIDSLLESDYVFEALSDRRIAWLEVSPRLFFNVLLRRSLPGRRQAPERRAIQYIANLLGLFTRTERMYRVQADEERSFHYLVDLVQEAAHSTPERVFAVHSHIGNYALVLSGLFAPWIEHRRRYYRRPVSLEYYSRSPAPNADASCRRHRRIRVPRPLRACRQALLRAFEIPMLRAPGAREPEEQVPGAPLRVRSTH